jgi:hypothetical protein
MTMPKYFQIIMLLLAGWKSLNVCNVEGYNRQIFYAQ